MNTTELPQDAAALRTLAETIKQITDRQAIQDALVTYCRGIDRCDLELALSIVHLDDPQFADALRLETTASVERHRDHYLSSIHYVTNVVIRLDGDTASSESYLHGTLKYQRDGQLYHQKGGGRWLDRWAFRNGAWRISQPRKFMLEWSRLDPVAEEMTAVSKEGAQDRYSSSARDRQDLSYDFVP